MSARWRYILQEAIVGLRRNLMMTVAVILSVAVSLMLLGASLLLRNQVNLAAGEWTGKIEVSIFLCDGRTCPAITDEQREELASTLSDDPVVAEVFYESKDEAYEHFVELFEDQPELVETVRPEALPASFRVKLEDPEQFAVIRDRFEAYPGVESIIDQRKVLEEFLSLARVVRIGAIGVAVIQLLAAIALIANTIRVAAFARREQTSIMKLVGASNWFIRLPFIFEGIIAGFAGAVVAWLVLLAGSQWLLGRLRDSLEFMPFIGISETVGVGVWLILAGIGISTVSSFLALHRHLDV